MSRNISANVLRASHRSTHLCGNSSSGAGTTMRVKVEHVHSIDKEILKEAKRISNETGRSND